MTRVNTEQSKFVPWFAKAGAACSIVPISRFVGPNVFALKGGGYGCLFSLTGIDEEGLTDQELDSRMRSIEGSLRGLPEGSWENRPALHLTSPTEYRAYYRPSTDSVHMPARSRFVDTAHYYSTLFHELIHSTGHESRLDRTFGDRFGDELYSKEELVAEMGAAFLSAIAGIANEHTDRNTTAYIQNWISKLEEDNRLIIHAAANAQKAVDSILGSTFEDAAEQPVTTVATEELAEVA